MSLNFNLELFKLELKNKIRRPVLRRQIEAIVEAYESRPANKTYNEWLEKCEQLQAKNAEIEKCEARIASLTSENESLKGELVAVMKTNDICSRERDEQRALKQDAIIQHGNLFEKQVELLTHANALAEALEKNHQWHQDYDEYEGYPDSELFETNTQALAAFRKDFPK